MWRPRDAACKTSSLWTSDGETRVEVSSDAAAGEGDLRVIWVAASMGQYTNVEKTKEAPLLHRPASVQQVAHAVHE